MSPYLFTIVMEVFNLIIQQKIKEDTNFKYHFECKGMKITHLCFVDDLLVLCHGDVNSDKVIKKALEYFSNVSVLYPNLSKSTIVCGSMDIITIDNILHILPFKRGKLHVRYLGVPLAAKNIGVKDCKSKKDSLWVKWVTIVKLKGRSVWEMEKHNNDSWMWKSLLDLRSKVSQMRIYILNALMIIIGVWPGSLDFIYPIELVTTGCSNYKILLLRYDCTYLILIAFLGLAYGRGFSGCYDDR
ncbi:RNA-directed DNA polymerase, eukaryota, reverse transcriptase zinc-binding domain protein [Tanacetum coccineum]